MKPSLPFLLKRANEYEQLSGISPFAREGGRMELFISVGTHDTDDVVTIW